MTVVWPSQSSNSQRAKRELSCRHLQDPGRPGLWLLLTVATLGVGSFQVAAQAADRSSRVAAEAQLNPHASLSETSSGPDRQQAVGSKLTVWQYRQSVDLPLSSLTEAEVAGAGDSAEVRYVAHTPAVLSATRFSETDLTEQSDPTLEGVAGDEIRIIADVPVEVLMASRDRFRDLVLKMPDFDLAQIDQTYAGSLAEPTQSRLARLAVQGSNESLRVVNDGLLSDQKTYTVVAGQIVEVNPESYVASALLGEGEPDEALSGAAVVAQEVVGPKAVGAAASVSQIWPNSEQFFQARTKARVCLKTSLMAQPQTLDEFLGAPECIPRCSAPSCHGSKALKDAGVISTLAFSGENGLLSGHANFLGHEDASARTGAYVRGRVALPPGMDARSLIVRVAGSSLQVRPDTAGFFELGPFALGSSFELLLFDEEGYLNRRIVPVFVSRQMREPEIQMFRSREISQLARLFRAEHRATDAGFCGEISSADRLHPVVTLVDDAGRQQRLWYFSHRGFPAPSRHALSSSRRICAFGLKGGLYRLSVTGAQNRAVFEIHTRPSTFENGMLFDAGARQYVRTLALGFVDSHMSRASLGAGPGHAVSLAQALQNLWLSDQDTPVWTPVVDFLLRSTPAYAAVRVEETAGTRFIPTGEELVKLFEPKSRSFELIGREEVRAARSEKEELPHHVLPEDTVRDLRLLLPGQPDEDTFLVFGDIDTALLPAKMSASGDGNGSAGGRAEGGGDFSFDQGRFFDVSVRDIWTGERLAGAFFLSEPSDRVLRFAIPSLANGSYLLHIRNPRGQLAWSSVIRAAAGETQIVSNR